MPIMLGLLWIGSLVAGWNFYVPWLAVPVLFFMVVVLRKQSRVMLAFRSRGMSGGDYGKQMFVPNVMVVGWNSILNAIIFGAGAGFEMLFRLAVG